MEKKIIIKKVKNKPQLKSMFSTYVTKGDTFFGDRIESPRKKRLVQ